MRCHDAYRFERDALAAAAESDYLLVNLWRAPRRACAIAGARSSGSSCGCRPRSGFRARPHMLRHSFASEVALATKDPAFVKELLGHASVASTDVYLHARWDDMRAAVEAHGQRGRRAGEPDVQPLRSLTCRLVVARQRRPTGGSSGSSRSWATAGWPASGTPTGTCSCPSPGAVCHG